MPAPYYYYCSKCDFSGSSMSTWGGYYYQSEDETVLINRRVGICHECNSITSVEILPTQKHLEEFKKKSSNENSIKQEENRLKLLSGRESEARCLNCGAHDFDMIPHPEVPDDRDGTETPWRTGLNHKYCGGRIYMKRSPANFFMGDNLEKKFFDVEGKSIETMNN